MKKPTLIKFFGRLSDADLHSKTSHVIQRMIGNSNFTTLQQEVTTLKELHQAYSLVLRHTQSRTCSTIAVKITERTKLIAYMQKLAVLIENICKGDAAKLLSSGFELAANKEHAPNS